MLKIAYAKTNLVLVFWLFLRKQQQKTHTDPKSNPTVIDFPKMLISFTFRKLSIRSKDMSSNQIRSDRAVKNVLL